LELAALEVWRDKLARGDAAVEEAAARYAYLIDGGIGMATAQTLGGDTPLQAKPGADIRRIGLVVVSPDPTAPEGRQIIHLVVIGEREEAP